MLCCVRSGPWPVSCLLLLVRFAGCVCLVGLIRKGGYFYFICCWGGGCFVLVGFSLGWVEVVEVGCGGGDVILGQSGLLRGSYSAYFYDIKGNISSYSGARNSIKLRWRRSVRNLVP